MEKTMKMNNGLEIPIVGLGTYKSPAGHVEQAVKYAIDAGYRHFDCAWFYGNEEEVGDALNAKIQDGTVKREELFITSKLWCNFHEKELVLPMIKESLANLKLDYLDLYLIHWPFGFKKDAKTWPTCSKSAYSDTDYMETWEGMEDCVNQGLAKSIGVSNFNSEQLARVMDGCKIKPVVNQVEVNPNINQKKLIDFCKQREVIVVGYCPIGRADADLQEGLPTPTIQDPKVIEMAAKYTKSPAQVVLNYLVSLGICVIPKSVTQSRIAENINIFDFTLEADDVAYLDSCDKNKRVCFFECYKKHKFFPFAIEF